MTSYVWTVYYMDGTSREVYAYSQRGALRAAVYAAKSVLVRGIGARACRAVCRYAVGSGATDGLQGPAEAPEGIYDERG